LGNFDECYDLQVNVLKENHDKGEITGRYCLVDLEYKEKNRNASIFQKLIVNWNESLNFDPKSSFWKAIEVYIISELS